jgi:hypothetical protein
MRTVPRNLHSVCSGEVRVCVIIDGVRHLRSAFHELISLGFECSSPPLSGVFLSDARGSIISTSRASVASALWDSGATTAVLVLRPRGAGEAPVAQLGPTVVLELVDLPWLTTARRIIRKQPRARIAGIDFGPGSH